MQDVISIDNATNNNLKNVSVDIPKHKIVAVTGISGSGKSSLVFDTIASESQRLLNENYSSFIQNILPKYPKPLVDSISNLPVSLVINQKRIQGNPRSTVGTITDIYSSLRLLYSRMAKPFIGFSMKYSFNNPEGMCTQCNGLGEIKNINLDKLLDVNKSLNEGAIQFPTFQKKGWRLTRYTESGYFDNNKKISEYSKDELQMLLYSPKVKPKNPSNQWHKTAEYFGVIPRITESFINVDSGKYKKDLNKILDVKVCPSCNGTRLNDEVLSSKIESKSIADCCEIQITELLEFINKISNNDVKIITDDLKMKLQTLRTVGLDYLTLNRATSTLSGGESQRIKLTKYLNNALTDVLYIFDEPSVGLHPHDITGINNIFRQLRDKGNSILFVDHDPDMIAVADEIINFGEGAGTEGGNVTFQGAYKELLKSDTVTGRALTKQHYLNNDKKKFVDFYTLDNVSKNNIKNISIKIPKNALTLVTGVAGSGKSTLIRQLFTKKYSEVSVLDQSLPHASSRSNLATYLNIFNEIKKLFSAKNDIPIAMFSNSGKGACSECKGKGYVKLDLAYLGDSVQVCEKCHGKKFNDTTLTYTYNGKNISEVLNLTVSEALDFFDDNQIIKNVLTATVSASLDYIKLGQTLDTFSGGELQRLKISQMLSKKISQIIILDEPSTGLHESDIDNLINLFHELINDDNTLIVLEHNLSIISQSDWIIDLGPKGGAQGGKLLYQGYPVDFIDDNNSYTAKYLREFIK
ncbi:excinuclease ABC subunit A [Companilactobacillus sp. RD055328]|uniref:ATP-binding cassette domain-containing protein n=1 Tax=Companilactobacillus sp. RD055328 TaxID=2916634 RepID=UPI001FC8C724|nr:excinuclease ABC subunit UvrA [Companilactobacillus sp. RD055328]GKQ42406.1 excinuclease ABC subunit A [Companilactobacillus sp. RD055328]